VGVWAYASVLVDLFLNFICRFYVASQQAFSSLFLSFVKALGKLLSSACLAFEMCFVNSRVGIAKMEPYSNLSGILFQLIWNSVPTYLE
jgi:hypothetical protein